MNKTTNTEAGFKAVVKISDLRLSANALTSLQEVGLTDAEVAADFGRFHRGETTRDGLLALCLTGAEDEGSGRVAAWTEYVDAVVARAKP